VKILFVHEVNYISKPIFEMHEFPEYLADRGHEVAFLHYPEGFSLEQSKEVGFSKRISGRVVKTADVTLYTPQISARSFFDRVLHIVNVIPPFLKAMRDFSPDIVVNYAVPTSGWQVTAICRVVKVPVVFRSIDVSHKIRQVRWLGPFIRLAERMVYSMSNHVSANNRELANYCSGLGAKSVSVNLPPLDLRHFKSPSKQTKRSDFGFSSQDLVAVYMGTFFYFSGLPEFLKRFADVCQSRWKVLLVGGGEKEAELRELVTRLGLSERVAFAGFVDFGSLPSVLSVADCGINTMVPSLVSDSALPNKVLQYLGSNLPVISTTLKGLEGALLKSCINVVPTPEAVADALEDLSPESLGDCEVHGSHWNCVDDYSLLKAVPKFEEVLGEVLGRSNSEGF
jgi:glycosyltransferase involved in cell wall biosynthesis